MWPQGGAVGCGRWAGPRAGPWVWPLGGATGGVVDVVVGRGQGRGRGCDRWAGPQAGPWV